MGKGIMMTTWGWVQRHPVLTTFILALVVRLVAIAVLSEATGNLILDDATYQGMAEAKATGGHVLWDAHTLVLYDLTATLVVPLTFLYEIFGDTPVPGQVLVALAGAGTAALVARLILEIGRERWALWGGSAAALLPSQVLWSTAILKEALVWLMLSAIAMLLAVANRSSRWRLAACAAGIALCLFLLGHLRLHTLVVAAIATVLASFFGRPERRPHRVVALTAVALVVPWLVGIGPGGFELMTDFGSLEARRLANAEDARSALLDAEALKRQQLAELLAKESPFTLPQIAEEVGLTVAEVRELKKDLETDPGSDAQQTVPVEDSSVLDPNLRHLPRGVVAMLVEPFPWQQPTSSAFRFAQLETLIWYPLLILAIVGLPGAFKELEVMAFPLLAGGGVLLMYALAEGNLGTAYRHRGEFVWVVIVLAILGAKGLAARRGRARSLVGRHG